MLQCLKREPGFYRYLWGLTGPIALQNLITFTLGLMDTLMVSWLGNTQMAAVTTANVPVFLLISIVFGVQSGLSILVSQYWGKRDMEHISRAIGVAAMLGTGLTVVLAAVFLGYLVCSAFTWYAWDPLYQFLNWVRDYIVFVCMLVILLGWVAISYSFIARPMRLVDTLAAAAEQLAQPGEEPIELPEPMEDLEGQLNAVRERALRDARAAREAEQRKNDLVVYLAHDLKTPLTSVIGYLTLLRDEPQLSPELRSRYTGIALEKAERLEDLINEFFDITRFSLTHLELEKQPTDLTRMLEQVASEFAPQFAEKDLRCELELPPRLAYDCDPDKLARVFDNLLRNAFHYSFPGSTVRITGQQEADTVVLTFTNEGRTIPAEKLERIFDQFFRLDSSRATRTGGAGLGLAIAKEIIALHGGTIRAASADNRITFTVRLPLQGAAARNS